MNILVEGDFALIVLLEDSNALGNYYKSSRISKS